MSKLVVDFEHDELLSKSRVASHLNVSVAVAGVMIENGTLATVTVGRTPYVPRSIADEWLASGKEPPSPPVPPKTAATLREESDAKLEGLRMLDAIDSGTYEWPPDWNADERGFHRTQAIAVGMLGCEPERLGIVAILHEKWGEARRRFWNDIRDLCEYGSPPDSEETHPLLIKTNELLIDSALSNLRWTTTSYARYTEALSNHGAGTQIGDKFYPGQSYQRAALSVKCPECGSEPQEPCV